MKQERMDVDKGFSFKISVTPIKEEKEDIFSLIFSYY